MLFGTVYIVPLKINTVNRGGYMRSEKNIFLAFLLNLTFSILEFIGGILTGSVAILSDAVHDIGDASSIGISYVLEKKSKKQPDKKYTYGYGRYSVLGSVITSLFLLFGSLAVTVNAIIRIFIPTNINYNGMIILAIFGAAINLCAQLLTKKGGSLNQKAVSLHMLEDALGWIAVLTGALLMKFTDIKIIDPIISILIAVFIFIIAFKNLKTATEVFLEKAPQGVEDFEIKEQLCSIDGISDVHHIHIWSIDGQNVYATMHIVAEDDAEAVKKAARTMLKKLGICHVTLETEIKTGHCDNVHCHAEYTHNDVLCHGHNHRHLH